MQHQLVIQIVVDVAIFAAALAGCVAMGWANSEVRQPAEIRHDESDERWR
jgi:hypothetical protein